MPTRPILPHPFDPTMAIVQLTKGYQAVVSAIDAQAVGRFTWCAIVSNSTVYALRRARRTEKNPGKAVPLHKFVAELAGIDVSHEVDHVDGNGLNCIRSNLRAATHAQNMANLKVDRRNKSGFRGVFQ